MDKTISILPYREHPRVKLINAEVLHIRTRKGKKGEVRDLKIKVSWEGSKLDKDKVVIETCHRTLNICGVPIENRSNPVLVVSPTLPISKAYIGLIWAEEPGKVYWNS